MVDTLFRQQNAWVTAKPVPPLLVIAKQAGFTEQTFDTCLANQKLLDGIQNVRQTAIDTFKVQSTPTFFINGDRYAGALTIEQMAQAIDPQLKGG
jgi:protein-disulfide isomerase